MRDRFPLVLLILLLVSGFLFYQRSQATQRSPFALGEAAAGMRYQELVDAEARGEKLNLACQPIASGYRICTADTDGPPGQMVVAVNDKGRIAVLRMRFDDTTYKMRELTSAMTNGWDELAPRTTTGAEGEGDVLGWRSADKRWSVEMVMRETVPTPAWVVMRDDGGIALTADRSVPALLTMAREGLVGDDVLDAVEKAAPGSLVRAADTLTAGARTLATHAAALPRCNAEPALVPPPGVETPQALGEAAGSIAEQAIALAFPGRHLSLGESTYLADRAGTTELVSLTTLSGDDSGVRFVFALNFQSRVDAVAQRAKAFSTAGQCRAPSELVIVQLDSASETVTRATHAPVETEALSSRVTSAVFSAGADGKQAVAIEYLAQYGDAQFAGQVEWWAVMPIDSMTLRSRVPISFARQDVHSQALAGSFNYAMPEDGDPGSSGGPLDHGPLEGRRVSAVTQRGGQRRTERVVIPSPINGLSSGWTILSLF